MILSLCLSESLQYGTTVDNIRLIEYSITKTIYYNFLLYQVNDKNKKKKICMHNRKFFTLRFLRFFFTSRGILIPSKCRKREDKPAIRTLGHVPFFRVPPVFGFFFFFSFWQNFDVFVRIFGLKLSLSLQDAMR